MRIHAILPLLALLLGACAHTPAGQARIISDWTFRHGGLAPAPERVTRIGRQLAALARCPRATFHVLDNPTLAAHSWPTGEIFVTRGLVDASSDDQLAAAIAHELGHILTDRDAAIAFSLRGSATPSEAERRADYLACRILSAAGRPREALIETLQKICAAADSPECRSAIQSRIGAITR